MFVGKFKCRNKREKKVYLSNLFVRVNKGFNLGGNVCKRSQVRNRFDLSSQRLSLTEKSVYVTRAEHNKMNT